MELWQVAPDAQQRLLRRVLGEVEVAQDPARNRQEPIRIPAGKDGVRLLVTALSSRHEFGVHSPFRMIAWVRNSYRLGESSQ